MRVLAALSGGVDSAVAAARAVDAGHDVVGVHMALSRSRSASRTGSRGCCTIEDASDARRAADRLGIPFYVWDLAEEFEQRVVADFLAEYSAGRTPNPCVRCNEHIKFAELLARGRALGFDAVCTGHYARIERGGGAGADGAASQPELHRGAFPAKDQSYVLAVMGRAGLDSALFPLGDAPSKEAVRAEAAARGLAVSEKPDSYDICFVADGDTRGFLRERLGEAPGAVVDEDGTELARHDGVHGFTIGQRKGLGLGRPAPDGAARYVLDIRPVTREVVVGPAGALDVAGLTGTDAVWLAPDVPCADWTDAEVQVRAHGRAHAARVRVVDGTDGPVDGGGTLDVEFTGTPPRGVAAGQSVVVYAGTRVLGQATVDAVRRAA